MVTRHGLCTVPGSWQGLTSDAGIIAASKVGEGSTACEMVGAWRGQCHVAAGSLASPRDNISCMALLMQLNAAAPALAHPVHRCLPGAACPQSHMKPQKRRYQLSL